MYISLKTSMGSILLIVYWRCTCLMEYIDIDTWAINWVLGCVLENH